MSETLAPPTPLTFSPASKLKIQDLVSRYPRKQAALIPTLYIAQDEFGWLQPEVMELVARELELPIATVLSTAMFYTMLHKQPVGKYNVQICTNVSCYLLGSDQLMETARDVLGIEPGETTADGQFTLQEVQCLCACDRAPTLQINKQDYFNVTPDKLQQVLEHFRATAGQKSGGVHA
jgi:NADH-quinone oxidoreductase subunit E